MYTSVITSKVLPTLALFCALLVSAQSLPSAPAIAFQPAKQSNFLSLRGGSGLQTKTSEVQAVASESVVVNGIGSLALAVGLVAIPMLYGTGIEQSKVTLWVTAALTSVVYAGYFLQAACGPMGASMRQLEKCFVRNMLITQGVHMLYVFNLAFRFPQYPVINDVFPLFLTGTVCFLILGLTKGRGLDMVTAAMPVKIASSTATHTLWFLYALSYVHKLGESASQGRPKVHHIILCSAYILLGLVAYVWHPLKSYLL